MDVTDSTYGTVTVLHLSGAFIGDDCEELDVQLQNCVGAENYKIVLEVDKVPFIDSDGLDKLLAIAFDFNKHGGDARVAAPNDIINDVLKATRVDSLVQVYEDVEEAVKSLL